MRFLENQKTVGKPLQNGSAELSTPPLESIFLGERHITNENLSGAQKKGFLNDFCLRPKTKNEEGVRSYVISPGAAATRSSQTDAKNDMPTM